MPGQLIPLDVTFLGEPCKLLIISGERGRNRTFNLLIKSSRGSEESDISSHRRINDLPTTEPARKRFDLVLKRSTLAHLGPKRTAHLRHTCGFQNIFRSSSFAVVFGQVPPAHHSRIVHQKFRRARNVLPVRTAAPVQQIIATNDLRFRVR